MALLEVCDLEVEYRTNLKGRFLAVAGASLEVDRGEILSLVGETGCGKSSLARAVVGLVPKRSGTVLLEGVPLNALTRRSRPVRDRRVQMVFQNPFSSLNPRRRLGDQISDGLPSDLSGTDRRRKVAQLLDRVGLPTLAATRYPHEYSGGQRQRAAIARALAASPSVMVLDEPLSSLDASAQAQIATLLTELARDLGMAMLLISHDLRIVQKVAHRVAVMYLGRVVETGPTDQLWSSPLHPYTAALIKAIPFPDGMSVMPVALLGDVPSPSDPPTGCRFHPRCPLVFDGCAVNDPVLLPAGNARFVACWLHSPPRMSTPSPSELSGQLPPASSQRASIIARP
jgi:oligopeptide/dipeptide ABC transporter ATP-binding protein